MSRILDRVDYSLILPVFFLLIIGVFSVYVAVNQDYPETIVPMVGLQLMWIGLGTVLAFLVMFFHIRFLWKGTPVFYAFGLGLMVLPLVFYNPSLVASTGAKNWITIGSTTLFQPSEFMKMAYIVMLARIVVSFQRKHPDGGLKQDFHLIGLLTLFTIPVLILLALQSDLGTALVFLAIYAGVILMSGVSWKILLPVTLILIMTIGGFLLLFFIPGGTGFLHSAGMSTYQINRISSWLDPFKNAQTTSYQQAQGLVAIGSGGLTGNGFASSEVLVPVRESDMIFTVIAESTGFVGSTIVILLYLLLIYRMLRITLQSNNRFYTYIATGFIMMLLFHIFENIGAATGILPLTGIPLPFISQGGSSMIANLIGVGLVLSMSYHNNLTEEQKWVKRQRKLILKK
ncbi:FtsW/RodA/SpoVE family cell cycle protein [Streptococcus sp. DD13]|uniref:FtsW/RodA/SpoVE family cell cycle protein n=1 Tax=Streptococcus sp. DD13 TaxID=1777881 RepID=UPI00083631CE|nr:FtsW/RodA/SpoVE family cell cycle protein [Streptococcus sp. DD13]